MYIATVPNRHSPPARPYPIHGGSALVGSDIRGRAAHLCGDGYSEYRGQCARCARRTARPVSRRAVRLVCSPRLGFGVRSARGRPVDVHPGRQTARGRRLTECSKPRPDRTAPVRSDRVRQTALAGSGHSIDQKGTAATVAQALCISTV